jgi:hypothetical protein
MRMVQQRQSGGEGLDGPEKHGILKTITPEAPAMLPTGDIYSAVLIVVVVAVLIVIVLPYLSGGRRR